MSNFDSNNTDSTIFVDIGNSSIKIGFLEDEKWTVHTFNDALKAAHEINNYVQPVLQVIVSSVRENVSEALINALEHNTVKRITVQDIDPSKLDYETPETLGIDRYLGCLGAQSIAEKPVVVIDSGTACTVDYMDANGVFHGGVIMPGFRSVLNIFKETAPELPEVEVAIPETFPGKSTKTSLQWGLVGFFMDGLISVLQAYDSKFPDYELYLTGGDADLLSLLLGDLGEVRQHLVFEGMKQFA